MREAAQDFNESTAVAQAASDRRVRAAITSFVLTAALIVSIVAVFAVIGASVSVAQSRADLIIFDDSTRVSTFLILIGVLVVMAVLTIMALRDTTPASRVKRAPARRAR